MSFGGPKASRTEYELIISAFAGGSTLVAAAGNSFQEGNPVNYPAAYPHVLTVAATDHTGNPATFSSSGPYVDLAAPGVEIPVQYPTDPNLYWPVDGTSFSAPIVSAAAAWAATARRLEKTQLFDLVRWTARDTAAPGWDERAGYGIVDIPAMLAATPPPVDPQEPNDDIDQVTVGEMFTRDLPPINGVAGGNGSLAARVDDVKDPDDVYRVVVPAKKKVTVSVTADDDVRLDLWNSVAQTVWTGRAGRILLRDTRGSAESATWRNPRTFRQVIYAHVRLSPNSEFLAGSYTLRVRVTK
jgi:Subtilase family